VQRVAQKGKQLMRLWQVQLLLQARQRRQKMQSATSPGLRVKRGALGEQEQEPVVRRTALARPWWFEEPALSAILVQRKT